MMYRILPFAALTLALVLTPARAEEKKADLGDSHDGTVVSVTGTKLVMKDKDDKEHTHTIADDAVIMIDGKKSNVSTFRDLKAGTKIRVWTKKDDKTMVLKIEALDKNKDFEKGTDK
jgi:hypothetical protein